MGIPVMIDPWEPHPLAKRWVIAWERYKILAYKTHDEAVAAAKRLGYTVINESPVNIRIVKATFAESDEAMQDLVGRTGENDDR